MIQGTLAENIRRILKESVGKARELLEENRDKLDVLAEELIKKETLSSDEIRELLDLKRNESGNA